MKSTSRTFKFKGAEGGHEFTGERYLPGDTITIKDNATVLGSATVGSDGKWIFSPLADLANGAHHLTAVATNTAGALSSPSADYPFTIDTSAATTPVITNVIDAVGAITGNVSSGGSTDDGSPLIKGTGHAGDTITIKDGTNMIGVVTVAGDNTWSYKPTFILSNGPHSLTATASTVLGATSGASAPYTFTVQPDPITGPLSAQIISVDDRVGPVQGPVGNHGTTDDPNNFVNGTGQAGDLINVYDGFNFIGSTTVGPDGAWRLRPSNGWTNGDHVITADSVRLGQTAHSNIFYFTETGASGSGGGGTAQTPSITSLYDDVGNSQGNVNSGGTTDDTKPTIGGSGHAGDTIKIYDGSSLLGSAVVNASGAWSFTPTTALANGGHDLTATASGNGQNTSASSGHYTFTVAPDPIVTTSQTPSITSAYDNFGAKQGWLNSSDTTDDTTPTLYGKGHAGDVITVKDFGNVLGSTVVDGSGNWNFTTPTLALNKIHDFTAVAQGAGQMVSASSNDWWLVTNPDTSTGGTTNPTVLPLAITQMMAHGLSVPINNPLGSSPVTSDVNPIISGTGTAGAKITLYYTIAIETPAGQRHVMGTGTVDQTGHWTIRSNSMAYPAGADPTAGNAFITFFAVQDGSSATSNSVFYFDNYGNRPPSIFGNNPQYSEVLPQEQVNTKSAVIEHQTVTLDADPTAHFKQASAHVEGAHDGKDSIVLTGDHEILDLASLTGKTAAAKISGIEVFDLGGHHNTLKVSLLDVLNLGEQDLFLKDGKQQVVVKGQEGDSVDLSNTHIAGVADGQWQQHGTEQVSGVTYAVFEHSGAHVELLVQQGVSTVVH